MKEFNHSERFSISAAEGWLMLGCPAEAEHELDTVRPENLDSPEVLCLRWALNFRWKRWEEARTVARRWCSASPESLEAWIALANSMRESEGLERAKQMLLEITKKFPNEWVIPYNLACYCSQMGEIAEAVLWLNKALAFDPHYKIQKEAASDPDLAPLWEALTESPRPEELCTRE